MKLACLLSVVLVYAVVKIIASRSQKFVTWSEIAPSLLLLFRWGRV